MAGDELHWGDEIHWPTSMHSRCTAFQYIHVFDHLKYNLSASFLDVIFAIF